MNVAQLKEFLTKVPDHETIYSVTPLREIIPLQLTDVYYGPICQEDASEGRDTLVIAIRELQPVS